MTSAASSTRTPKRIARRERRTVARFLDELGFAFTTPTPHQIKAGEFSFYPTKGIIVRDGHPKVTAQGSAAFIRLFARSYGLVEDPGPDV